jgi:hypothetical protein
MIITDINARDREYVGNSANRIWIMIDSVRKEDLGIRGCTRHIQL